MGEFWVSSTLLFFFQWLRIRWAGTANLCPETWLTASSRSCRAASSAATSASTPPPRRRTQHLSASATSACRARPATNLGRRCDNEARPTGAHRATTVVVVSFLFRPVCASRLLRGRRTAWRWPSSGVTMIAWWFWMETPRTPLSLSSSRTNTRTATWSATSPSRTW